MNNIIGVIQPEEVLLVSEVVKSDIVSDVFIANIINNGVNHQVYLKAYSFHNQAVAIKDRGLLNEIIGYIICHHYKVPQPKQAFIALVQDVSVAALLPKTSERLKASYENAKIIPMFATTRIDAKALPHIYHHSIKQFIEPNLINWKHRNKAALCDEIIANTDRLPKNILTANRKDFWLVDNGRLVAEEGTNWRNVDLQPTANLTNYLADLDKKDIQADSRKGNDIIEHAYKTKKPLQGVLAECEYWIDMLSSEEDKPSWHNFLKFIRHRNDNIGELMIQRYGMLL